MKKKELETLEKINEERKLNKETKKKIQKKVLKNFLFATGILLFFAILKLLAINLEKQLIILIYKVLSVSVFVVTLILFEVAYKKDNDSLAITSIEMFFLSILTLLTPYTLISRPSIYTSIIGVYFTVYYMVKNFIIYRQEKKEYLKEKNDITQIVKKESQDKIAQEQLEKIRQEKEENTPKSKRGRPRKTTNKASTKTTEKTEQKETVPKRKRGRPRKK